MDNEDEKTDGDSSQGHPSGWVYILENEGRPNLFKIGMTIHNPHLRASELSRETGIPSPFIVGRAYFVKDRYKAEKLIHKELEPYRFNENREFFYNYDERNRGWYPFQESIETILGGNFLLDECTSAARMNTLEALMEASQEVIAELKKEFEEANKKILRLKRTIEKLQNANQENNTSVISELPSSKPAVDG